MLKPSALLLAATLILGMFLPVSAQSAIDADIEKGLAKVKQIEGKGNSAALADALYQIGVRYNQKGNFPLAEQYLRQSLAVEIHLRRPTEQGITRFAVASVLAKQQKTDEARAEFDALLEQAKQLPDPNDVAVVYNNLAKHVLQSGNITDAEKYLRKGLSVSREARSGQAALLETLAEVCRLTHRQSEGINYLKDAAKIYDADGDDENWGLAMHSLAALQSDLKQYSESIDSDTAVAERMKTTPYLQVAASAELGIAEANDQLHRSARALEHYKAAQQYLENEKSSPDLSLRVLIGLGAAQADIEQFSEAQRYHQSAIDLAIQEKNIVRQIQAATQLANDYILVGSAERALSILKSVQSLDPKTADSASLKGGILVATGRCYDALGEKQASLSAYREAVAAYEGCQRPDLTALALDSLATACLNFNDIAGFESAYNSAKKLYASISAKTDEAKLDYNYGQSLLMRDKNKEAIAVFEAALDKVKGSEDTQVSSTILRGLGLACYLSGDYARSLKCYLDALSVSKESSSIETQWSCNLGVGKAYKALGQNNEARPYLETAVGLVEKERGNLSRDSFKTHTLDLRRDCFIELIDLYARLNKPYEALEVAERGKARAFLDMLMNHSERQIESGNGTNTSYLEGITVANSAANSNAGSRAVNVTTRDTSVTLDDNLVSSVNAQAPTIDEIRALVKKSGSTFIEYWALRDKIYVWVLAPDGSIHMPPAIAINNEVLKRINNLSGQITTSITSAQQMKTVGSQRQENLRQLYTLLIKPVEQYLPADKDTLVTLVPHNFLFSVPFAALIAADGSYLIEKHTLSYTPAIGVLRATQALADELQDKPHKLLGFGNPITKEIAFLGTLPYSEKEVKHIAALYGAGNASTAFGADATKEKFALLAPAATDIHLATHGLIDQDHPMKSGLVLAPTQLDDGLLTVRDILMLKNLKARMVVLSACQTGRGKVTGDGVVGLSRAFIIAGTPSVLVSQWNVDDVMTEYQMTKFYQSYLKGTNKARALRDAQLATIKFMEDAPDGTRPQSDPAYIRANPRFWAAFQLIGEHR